MPVQVGIHWWLGIPAVWAAYRRRSMALAFIATAFLLLMLYLQFGSGSLASYAPLPKTPRYTALVTPLLMLLAGSWLADQFFRNRRSAAVAVGLAAALAAVPCIAYLDISSSERTRNTLAVLPALRAAAPEQLFTDYYGARVLRILEPELAKVSVWYHARFDTNEIIVLGNPAAAADTYVLFDRQAAKIYTSSYEMTLPPEISVPPADWQLVWSGRAYEDGSVTRTWLEGVRAAANWLPNGNPLSSRIERSIADLIDADQAYLVSRPGIDYWIGNITSVNCSGASSRLPLLRTHTITL